jgi:hypothetical protein
MEHMATTPPNTTMQQSMASPDVTPMSKPPLVSTIVPTGVTMTETVDNRKATLPSELTRAITSQAIKGITAEKNTHAHVRRLATDPLEARAIAAETTETLTSTLAETLAETRTTAPAETLTGSTAETLAGALTETLTETDHTTTVDVVLLLALLPTGTETSVDTERPLLLFPLGESSGPTITQRTILVLKRMLRTRMNTGTKRTRGLDTPRMNLTATLSTLLPALNSSPP